jgi:hypothetical protein
MGENFKDLPSQQKIETHGYTQTADTAGIAGEHYVGIKTNAQGKIKGSRNEERQSQGTYVQCQPDDICHV